jgi:hypothetical protein
LAILIFAVFLVDRVLFMFSRLRRRGRGDLEECGQCGRMIPQGTSVCPKCGTVFDAEVMRCSRCEADIASSSSFCPDCSAPLRGNAEDPATPLYMNFTKHYRATAREKLGAGFSETEFWKWWKRQRTFVPFSLFRLNAMETPPPGPDTGDADDFSE